MTFRALQVGKLIQSHDALQTARTRLFLIVISLKNVSVSFSLRFRVAALPAHLVLLLNWLVLHWLTRQKARIYLSGDNERMARTRHLLGNLGSDPIHRLIVH